MLSFREGGAEPARLGPDVARRAAECVLVAAIAIQTARLVWAAVVPLGAIGHPVLAAPVTTGADAGILTRFDPFHRGVVGAPATAPAEALAGLKLFGVRASGGGGSAIIAGPDGRQGVFAVGDTVAPGTTLQAIAADHVILLSGGRRSSLFFQRAGSGASVPATASPPVSSLITPAAPSLQGALQPRMENGRINGFSVLPGPGAEMMRDAGIQPGDVLLSVNGAALSSPDKAAELASQFADAGGAVVQYERGGQVNTATVKMSRP